MRDFTIGDLDRLGKAMADAPPAPSSVAPDYGIFRAYNWMRRLPVIGHSDLAISVASFIGCWVLYSLVLGDWFATGIMLMLLIHELGHYVEARRVGMATRPPVFVLLGAFVQVQAASIDGLTHARLSLAGGLAGGLATAVTLGLYVLTGSSHLLPWVAAGAAAAGLGVVDPLIPLIVFLAFVVLRLRYPGRWQRDLGALPTRARLVIAGAWLTLVAYLSMVLFLTAGWLT